MGLRVPAIRIVSLARIRAIIALSMLLVLASCASSGAREAEIALQEAEAVAALEEVARLAEETESARAFQMNRQKREQEAEEAMLQARRDRVKARRDEAAKIKMQEAQLLAEQAEEVEQQQKIRQAREQEIVAIAALRQAKMDRITELESLISRTGDDSGSDEASVMALNEAIEVAEDLLDALATEQTKYENTDASGNTVEPLAKSLITELESRKNDLVSRSRSQ